MTSLAAWQKQAEEIRQQSLVSCGLWPPPAKTPLRAKVFDRVERDGYTIEKVYFESYPGFFVGGNLYRPLGKGRGPFPAVLNPHGHWRNGRMADEKDGSVAARCITFARMGIIAFSHDMVGYNDTFFPDHGSVPVEQSYVRHRWFATNHVNQLWNISQMGLQTWNCIRALDFLESLPDVDPKRLACTGESGGGTQTFMLGATDNRLALQAPIVMVSHSMQGGCSCENAPGLRVDHSNMEIAAAAAPRPQMLVGATGDWTKMVLTVEGPAIRSIYRLWNAESNVHFVRFDYNHNYNQTSREAVYGWFSQWLLGSKSHEPLPEPAYVKEPTSELLVFPDGKLPPGAIPERQLTAYLIAEKEKQWHEALPRDKAGLPHFADLYRPAWQRTLLLHSSEDPPVVASQGGTEFTVYPSKDSPSGFAVTTPEDVGQAAVALIAAGDDVPRPAVDAARAQLTAAGLKVAVISRFSAPDYEDQFTNFFTTYNRTRVQSRVRDLVTAVRFARSKLKASKVVLCGLGTAGRWCLLAAPAADAVIADAAGADTTEDAGLLHPDNFVPGLRVIGTFQAGPILAAPRALVLFRKGPRFTTEDIEQVYRNIGAKENLSISDTELTQAQVSVALRSIR